jgi:hypothetical protein
MRANLQSPRRLPAVCFMKKICRTSFPIANDERIRRWRRGEIEQIFQEVFFGIGGRQKNEQSKQQ